MKTRKISRPEGVVGSISLLMLLLLTLPATGQAQFNYTTNNGTISITRYIGAGGAVIIPETINGLTVTIIGDFAFHDCISLTSITIPDSLTSIGDRAFLFCASLTSVMIPSSVINIGSGAFANCTGLTSVMLPDSVTSIGSWAFLNCSGLADITIPNSVTNIGEGAFANCSDLTNVTIPNSVTSIEGEAFSGCTSLTSVTIPDSVTSIGGEAFRGCTSLTAITVGDLNTAYSTVDGILFDKSQNTLIGCPGGKAGTVTIPNGVTSIGGSAFSGCTSLASVMIPSSVTNIGWFAFHGCTGLTSVTIPDSVTNIGNCAFENCTGLTSIAIPDSVTSIGGGAFSWCTGLTNITIPNSVTKIEDGAFSGCTSLAAIMVDSNNPAYSSLDGLLFNKNQTMLLECPAAKSGSYAVPSSVTEIWEEAFSGCASLTNVMIGPGVTKPIPIGWSLFSGCDSLRSITVDAENPAYASVGGVLFDKTPTKLIQYPWGKGGNYRIPDGTTTVGAAAFSCLEIDSITIPESVTTVEANALEGARGLYFEGNCPRGGPGGPSSLDPTVFHLPGKPGWTAGPSAGLWDPTTRIGYTTNDNAITVWGCAADGDLIIPSTLNGLVVRSIGGGSFLPQHRPDPRDDSQHCDEARVWGVRSLHKPGVHSVGSAKHSL